MGFQGSELRVTGGNNLQVVLEVIAETLKGAGGRRELVCALLERRVQLPDEGKG